MNSTQKAALGFFLNLGLAILMIAVSGMDSFGDWTVLVWSIVHMIACTYYVQADIKEALRKEEQ